MSDDRKPTGRECVLLYLAHYVRVSGNSNQEPETTVFGDLILTVNSWRMQIKTSSFAHQQYRKYQMPSTLGRRWRELKEKPREKLQEIGISVNERPPNEEETQSWNVVWDLHVNLEQFREGVQENAPWNEFAF